MAVIACGAHLSGGLAAGGVTRRPTIRRSSGGALMRRFDPKGLAMSRHSKIAYALIASLLTLDVASYSSAFAQDKMSADGMKKSTSGDGMMSHKSDSKDHMKNDAMKHDGMKGDAMKGDGAKHDSMSKDDMKK
jgi:pentapeptide MXKDX repeat protein